MDSFMPPDESQVSMPLYAGNFSSLLASSLASCCQVDAYIGSLLARWSYRAFTKNRRTAGVRLRRLHEIAHAGDGLGICASCACIFNGFTPREASRCEIIARAAAVDTGATRASGCSLARRWAAAPTRHRLHLWSPTRYRRRFGDMRSASTRAPAFEL